MKKVLFILFLFLISCSSPEEKIIQSFNIQRAPHQREFKAKSAEIYDTIFADQVFDKLDILNENINRLQDSLKNKKIRYSEFYQRELDHLLHQEQIYTSISSQIDKNISGFYVKIITNKDDTLNFLVYPLTYRIICPVFLIDNKKPPRKPRPLTNF